MFASAEPPALALYSRGFPLDEALRRFSPPEKWEAYQSVFASAPTPKPVTRSAAGETNLGAILQIAEQAAPFLQAWIERSGLGNGLRSQMIYWLSTGALIAYGYAVPRDPDDAPRRVPADIWQGKVNWRASRVDGNGLVYVGVRVLGAPALQGPYLDLEAEEQMNALAPPGRKSGKELVVAAYFLLKGNGKIDFARPLSHLAVLIRALLAEQHPNDSGRLAKLHDETIRVAIGSQFKIDKSKSQ